MFWSGSSECCFEQERIKKKKKWKNKSSVFLLSGAPTKSKDRGEDGREETSLSLSVCSSLYQCFYGDKERGWDRWKCCHGDRQGVRACVCMHVNECVSECACYPARTGSVPCVLPPEAFGTSLAALFQSPTAKRKRDGQRERWGRVRDTKLKDKRQTREAGSQKERQADGRRIIIYYKERLKTPKINVQFDRVLLGQKKKSCSFHPPLILFHCGI